MTDQIGELLTRHGADIVHVGMFDLAGMFRERRLRAAPFAEWLRDPRFANVCAQWDATDTLFGAGPFLTEPVAVDPGSFRRHGSELGAATLIADYAGPSRGLMPRPLLAAQVARAAAMGYGVRAAFEFEVVMLAEDDASLRAGGFEAPGRFAPDNRCWSGQTAADRAAFVTGLEEAILGHDVALFGVAGELGPGCFEATLAHQPPMKAADDAGFFRIATRAHARAQGMTASFMPFLGEGYPAIGGHVTLSLTEGEGGRNLFSGEGTSDLAKQFIAGMIDVVPEGFALCNNTINAYRRFAPGSWAPKSVSWAEWTYTTAVRSAPHTGEMARLEFRLPGADCNPHLALALMLGAGLDGIERGLAAPPPAEAAGPDDIPPGQQRLPRDLTEAASRLRGSEKVARIFGAEFRDHFATWCEVEAATLAKAVSAAERERYLEG